MCLMFPQGCILVRLLYIVIRNPRLSVSPLYPKSEKST